MAKSETFQELDLSNAFLFALVLGIPEVCRLVLELILGQFGLEILDKMPIQFTCNCTKSRVEKALISIGGKELQEMIDEGKSIEVNCQFCNKHYEFSVDELKKLYEKAKK